jgi:tetratricopeptide (TPR) repeat protein
LFGDARRLFVAERNQVWPALIGLYQALVLFREGRHARSRGLAQAALRSFEKCSLAGRAALCELLLARLDLAAGVPAHALPYCTSALERLRDAESPALSCHAWFVRGQVHEALGEPDAALAAYREAHARLEDLRSHLRGEELKIAFLKDKLAVYESLVWMSLDDPRAAFTYIEQAKSRSLADLIAFRARDLPASPAASRVLVEEARRMREEIAFSWRRIESEATRPGEHTPAYVERLRRRTRDIEGRLSRTLDELRTSDRDFIALQSGGIADLGEIRSTLPSDTLLLEYYQARVRDIAARFRPFIERDGLWPAADDGPPAPVQLPLL